MYSRSACSNVLLEIKGRSIGSEEKRESDFAPFSFGENQFTRRRCHNNLFVFPLDIQRGRCHA